MYVYLSIYIYISLCVCGNPVQNFGGAKFSTFGFNESELRLSFARGTPETRAQDDLEHVQSHVGAYN